MRGDNHGSHIDRIHKMFRQIRDQRSPWYQSSRFLIVEGIS
jgi:hypothetical protein